jgi:hypothetical protein
MEGWQTNIEMQDIASYNIFLKQKHTKPCTLFSISRSSFPERFIQTF